MATSFTEAVRRGSTLPRGTVAGAVVVLLGAALAGAFELRDRAYRDDPLPGVRVLTPDLSHPVDVSVAGRTVSIRPAQLFAPDPGATSRKALAAGRESLVSRVATLMSPVPLKRDVRPVVKLKPGASVRLAAQLGKPGRASVSARVDLHGTQPVVVPARAGRTIDRWRLLADVKARVVDGGTGAVVAHLKPAKPKVDTASAQAAAAVARTMLSHAVELTYAGRSRGSLQPYKLAELIRFHTLHGYYVADLAPNETARAAHAAVAAFSKPAKDATFNVSGNRVSVIASHNGYDVEPKATAAAVAAAASSQTERTADIVMAPSLPLLTTREAQALGITTKLVAFTTEMGVSSSNRVHNVHLMADFIDGTVIKPGETFSYNDVVGPRTAERGFREGQMIVGSLVLPAIGGGVCQTATTLFNDAFQLGLPIVERHNHSLYISHYPLGRDATVSWGGPDFKFRNDLKHGLLIKSSYTNSTLTFTFYGTPEGRRVVATTGPETNFRAPKMSYAVDPSAPAGSVDVVSGSNAQGFDVTVKRTVYDRHGKVLRRDSFASRYVPDGPTTVYGPGRTPPGPYVVIPPH
jgi:vancomycin resistance protein YoaR